MFNKNYYTPLLKNKRFLALLIETIFWAIVLVAFIVFLMEVKHG